MVPIVRASLASKSWTCFASPAFIAWMASRTVSSVADARGPAAGSSGAGGAAAEVEGAANDAAGDAGSSASGCAGSVAGFRAIVAGTAAVCKVSAALMVPWREAHLLRKDLVLCTKIHATGQQGAVRVRLVSACREPKSGVIDGEREVRPLPSGRVNSGAGGLATIQEGRAPFITLPPPLHCAVRSVGLPFCIAAWQALRRRCRRLLLQAKRRSEHPLRARAGSLSS